MFVYRLCLAAGRLDVDEALREIGSFDALQNWVAYGMVEPFGETRGDLRSAYIATQFANAIRGKGSQTVKLEYFLPRFKYGIDDKPQQTAEEQKALIHSLFVAMGAAKRKTADGT